MQLLDQAELEDYLLSKGDWTLDEDDFRGTSESRPPSAGVQLVPVYDLQDPKTVTNTQLEALIEAILLKANPPPPPPPPPPVPKFPLGIALLGKPYSGKTTQAKRLAERFYLHVISPDELLERALQLADGQIEEYNLDPGQETDLDKLQTDHEAEVKFRELLANLGSQSKSILASGKEIPDTIIVNLVVAAIERCGSRLKCGGWVIDGYPLSLEQVYLLIFCFKVSREFGR